ncbi:DoxX family membrane protein [Streptomyces roseiscleroticus]|uniref:DoxX family membrane protein n=1 Tax=Streptomyces roseiscleroticus TaxID=1972 RepID=A0ABN3EU95_9ACTN
MPSDPAQVIVNHASFRVHLAPGPGARSPGAARHSSVTEDTARIPVVDPARRPVETAGSRRRAPVVWSGRSAPDDTGAHRLLQAVRNSSVGHGSAEQAGDASTTQVIPRVDADGPARYATQGQRYGDDQTHPYGTATDPYGTGADAYGDEDYDADPTVETVETPVLGAQRTHDDHHPEGTRLLPAMRTVGSAYDEEPAYADDDAYAGHTDADEDVDAAEADGPDGTGARRHAGEPVRHAYYPGRRMNLGVVLLPLRVFLGFISIYAGMGKLCDPVYFDGGERGSMVKWLNTLHPWEVAEPLRQFALAHPVGAGLVIAFLQVIVGVLTVLGLWQRLAAVIGALLSAALIVTVSWKTVPAYDAPDIIYLAAWSPLITAGAPVYSVDGRLAAGAWRTLGPRTDIWRLRRYVLRRGALVTTVVVGLTLLVGSLLGGAVRDADRVVVPGPGEAPRNELPGSPLPQEPSRQERRSPAAASGSPTQGATGSASPSQGASSPGAAEETGAATGGRPSQTQGTAGQAPPPARTAPAQQAPSTSSGMASGGGATSGSGATSGGGATGGATGSAPGGTGSGGSSNGGERNSLVGGLLG